MPVELYGDPLSLLPVATRDLITQCAAAAISSAKQAWGSVAPELERIAAATLAKASLVAPATTQR